MNAKLLELATRHGALKAKIDEQRRILAGQTLPLQSACARGDNVLRGVDWLKHHPVAVGVAVLAVVIASPKRAWRWAKRGYFIWGGVQAIRKNLTGAG